MQITTGYLSFIKIRRKNIVVLTTEKNVLDENTTLIQKHTINFVL